MSDAGGPSGPPASFPLAVMNLLTWPIAVLRALLAGILFRMMLRFDPFARNPETNGTILHSAALLNDRGLALAGIASGINKRAVDSEGRTAAQLAVNEGYLDLAGVLQPEGTPLEVDLDVSDEEINSPEFQETIRELEASGRCRVTRRPV